MKMEITIKIKNDDGTVTEVPIEKEVYIPGYDDYKGPDTFLQDFDVAEKAVIKLRDDAIKDALETYLAGISKKKRMTKPMNEKNTNQ